MQLLACGHARATGCPPHTRHSPEGDEPPSRGCSFGLSAGRYAGVPGRIPHDFRRTAVRNLERAGVPWSTAMAMVGHQTETVYRRCAIVDAAMLKEGAAKLALLHAGQGSGQGGSLPAAAAVLK